MWFHDQGVLLQVNTGITLQMTSWHNTDIHTNTVRTNFNHFSTLPQNLVLLWLILFEKYFFKHSNPVSSVVSEIKSGVRGSYAAEKVGTLKVKQTFLSGQDWPYTSALETAKSYLHTTRKYQRTITPSMLILNNFVLTNSHSFMLRFSLFLGLFVHMLTKIRILPYCGLISVQKQSITER